VDPTVAYEMETDEELESEDPVGGSVDPTLPYPTGRDNEDRSKESGRVESTVPCVIENKEEDSVHVDPTVAYAMETDNEEENEKPVSGHVDPTVAYAMETDDEDQTEGNAGVEPTVPYKENEEPISKHVDPTVAYAMETDGEDQTEGSAGVEPTVADEVEGGSSEKSSNLKEAQVTGGAGPSVLNDPEVAADDIKIAKEAEPIVKSSDSVPDSDQTDIEEEVKTKPSTSEVIQEGPAEAGTGTAAHTGKYMANHSNSNSVIPIS